MYEKIGPKSLIEWVIDAAKNANLAQFGLESELVALIPTGDHSASAFLKGKCEVFEGPETDVLSRYVLAAQHYHADAVIRITGDCWRMPPHLIEACAKELKNVDYASNTVIRSFVEGWDIQGCSKMALDWFDEHQKHQREHPFQPFDENIDVRALFISQGFTWVPILNTANVIFHKTSVDTQDELEQARKYYGKSH